LRAKAVIAGIGHTAFGAHEGRSTVSLNVEAIRNALADANVEKDAVDALFLKYPTSSSPTGKRSPKRSACSRASAACGIRPARRTSARSCSR
jgi:acetyl-CoA acetyltransferase